MTASVPASQQFPSSAPAGAPCCLSPFYQKVKHFFSDLADRVVKVWRAICDTCFGAEEPNIDPFFIGTISDFGTPFNPQQAQMGSALKTTKFHLSIEGGPDEFTQTALIEQQLRGLGISDVDNPARTFCQILQEICLAWDDPLPTKNGAVFFQVVYLGQYPAFAITCGNNGKNMLPRLPVAENDLPDAWISKRDIRQNGDGSYTIYYTYNPAFARTTPPTDNEEAVQKH